MDEEKFEKMAEMMKGCCSMMRKMMRFGERKDTGAKKKKKTVETE